VVIAAALASVPVYDAFNASGTEAGMRQRSVCSGFLHRITRFR